jgi:hypothetical protein
MANYKNIVALVASSDMVSQIFAERKLNLLSNAQYFLITATHQHIL